MSFILDALRKSELERQRQHGPSIAEFAGARSDGRPPWALAAIGVLLALNVGVILFFLFRDARQEAPPAPAASAATATAQAPAPAPAPAQGISAPAAAMPPAGTTAPDAAPPAVSQQQLAAALEPPPATAELPPAAPDPTLVPASPSVRYDDAAPASDALAAQAAEGLPELSMDLHIYSADRAKRAVFINGRRYAEGATTAEGPVVEEITREGAVLNYRGRRFLLPRL